MFKCLMFFVCCLFSTTVLAQPATFQPPPSAPSSSGLLPVASPEDFKKGVSSVAEQTSNQLNQQSKDILSKVPPPPKSEPLETPAPTATSSTTIPPIEPKPTVTTPPPAQAKPLPTTTPTPQPVNPDAYSNFNRPAVSPTATPAPAATTGTPVPLGTTPQQTQIYTGFQAPPTNTNTSTTTTTTTTTPQQPKSGWNIRY